MRYILALLLLLTTSPLHALTLDDAVEAALQNHQRIEQSRAQTDQALAQQGSARSSFLPRLDLDYSYLKRDDDPLALGARASSLSLAASINLFNGLGDYHRYDAAKQRVAGANEQLRGTRSDIVLEARQAYIEGLRSLRSVATEAEGVELLERQRRDAELKFEYGLIARNDLLRVDVELSSARQALLNARGTQRISFAAIERVSGLKLTDDVNLEEIGDKERQTYSADDLDDYRRQMFDNRSELRFLRTELKALTAERKAAKSGYLPSLNLSLTHAEYDDQISPLSYDHDDNLVSLNASWALFDGFAREEEIALSDARVRALAALLRDTEAELVLQLDTALQQYQIAVGRSREARTGVLSAEENYRVTETRFQQQQATTVDLLDARFLLTRARQLEIDAQYDRYLSEAFLDRILEFEEY